MSAMEKLTALRQQMTSEGVGAYLVPRADEHLGEYVPACAERLAWLSGFTGSAGLAIVLADQAAIFSDGRYVLQLEQQTDPGLWQRLHVLRTPPAQWLAQAAPGIRLGYDPRLMTPRGIQAFEKAGNTAVPLEENLIDRIWHDRPPPPLDPLAVHPLSLAGVSSAEKRHQLADVLKTAGQNAAVITDPASICWLFNVRGHDVPHTPFALAFALLKDNGHADLFVDKAKITPETRVWLGNGVSIRPVQDMAPALAALGGKTVRFDGDAQPAWFVHLLERGGAIIAQAPDICVGPKARKNAAEQAGMRAAHLLDGAAVCRFLAFMAEAGPAGTETETSAAEKLLALRSIAPEFRGHAFSPISAAGEHGAIIHYRATPESNRDIRPDELYLTDSGGQYPGGTTDITRTLWTGRSTPPGELRDRYTRVLKGLIAIATVVFPEGTAGVHLDALARTALWQAGLDFDHGTGHGIGSYLSVHEGPASISRPLRPAPLEAGMMLSDEPGYYLPGRYGIRLENVVMATDADGIGQDEARKFLRFETLTLAPFEPRLIDASLLTRAEAEWLDAYHARVLSEVGPLLDPATLSWLECNCAPLAPSLDDCQQPRKKECSA